MAFPEENNSSFFKFDEPRTSTDNECYKNISQTVPIKDPHNKNDYMLHATLDYLNQILLEENIDEQFNGYQEMATISSIEKPFYDITGEKYPPQNHQLAFSQADSNHILSTSVSNDPVTVSSSSISRSPSQESRIERLLTEEFQKGAEEGMKFLPSINNLAIDLQVGKLSLDVTLKESDNSSKIELEEGNAHCLGRCNAKRSSTNAALNLLKGRNHKMSMLYTEEAIGDKMFDKVLLNYGEEHAREEISRLRAIMKGETNPQATKKDNKEDNIDLEAILIQCSEAVARNDRKIAEKLIKEIRNQASRVGSGAQRFAWILTDGLEARLTGTGSETFRRFVNRRIPKEMLMAYHMYITASPLLRVAYCFANEYICKEAENASKIHIVDLGCFSGFQWPPLIQALSKRKGGVPTLRITSIDLPQPGFRPAEQMKQIGVRLEEYAKRFGVPFEYQCIASLWECIRIKDLKIDDDEVLIVNCMFRFRHVREDTFPVSPRDQVLNLIKQMSPKIFILGIINGSISPFFTTRFRKVLSNYSVFFDMFDVLVPRDDEGRKLFERDILAPGIMNLVACEGPSWVERPETYKQWHRRILRAGFEQLAMDQSIVKDCNEKVKSGYHERFFIEEDSGWLLQGWKGRVIYGLSVWEPRLI
jgi:GRAS domain family